MFCIASTLAALAFSHASLCQCANSPTPAHDHSVWSGIEPSTDLAFASCYTDHECARVLLPLDAGDAASSEHISVAVIRRPARVATSDPRYGGMIFTNPGGPAGSVVLHVLGKGERLQRIVDATYDPPAPLDSLATTLVGANTKYFDIVSFDPRGVGFTEPKLSCGLPKYYQSAWDLESVAEGLIGSFDQAFNLKWARSEALALACGQDASRSLASHMSTVAVAEDMALLMDRFEEWRRSSHGRAIRGSNAQTPLLPGSSSEGLMYWGFSYGTVLGATFATLYPDKSHRVVLDGVSDAVRWHTTGSTTVANLRDTDAVMAKFFDYCHSAAEGRCKFSKGESRQDLEAKLDRILEDVSEDPIAVGSASGGGPDIVTYSDVMYLIRLALYDPMAHFETMASVFAELSHRNGSGMAAFKAEKHRASHCAPGVNADNLCYDNDDFRTDARVAIACGDGVKRARLTKLEYAEYQQEMLEASRWLGASWAESAMACATWDIVPSKRLNQPVGGKTKHPLLLISTLDPVTPLACAMRVSSRFPRSVVLRQDSEGHCSYPSDSKCTDQRVRAYFQSGTLPHEGEVCLPEKRPFE